MSIRPMDLPEIRARVAWWIGDKGPTLYEQYLSRGMIGWGDFGPAATPEMAQALTSQEVHRLLRAELFWVDEHMTDLVLAAAPSIPEFFLQPEDLPSPYGMIVFEKPLRISSSPDEYDDKVHTIAAVWGDATVAGSPHPGVWVSWYTDTARNYEHVDPRRVSADIGWVRLGLPPLSYDNESYIPFSDEPLGWAEPIANEHNDYRGVDLMMELRAAWILMQQPIATVSEAELDRSTRRRLERQKIEPKPVRIITLRRPKSSSEHGESDREYHHRWIVRGHWRQQWYPSREVHRPVWIAPHIKGPEDAPLLGGDKVYAWRQ
jgi:hypothetical protein